MKNYGDSRDIDFQKNIILDPPLVYRLLKENFIFVPLYRPVFCIYLVLKVLYDLSVGATPQKHYRGYGYKVQAF